MFASKFRMDGGGTNARRQRTVLFVSSLVSVLVLTSACDKFKSVGGGGSSVKLDTDAQKASYAIGTRIGSQMGAAMGPGAKELDLAAVTAGMSDVVSGAETRLKPEEMQAAIMKFQEAVTAKQTVANEALKKQGAEYLEKNKSKDGVKVTSTGLQYEVAKEGDGATPKPTDTVTVHYTGTFVDGKKFDSSVGGEPAQFQVNQVIPGWTEGLQMMKVGSKYKFSIPSNLAYGPEGRMPAIPPDAVLLFDVELLDIKNGSEPKASSKNKEESKN